MKMEHKVVPVTGFKVIDDARGVVGAFVSVTGVVDSVKDRIIPGAYEKTLAARTPKGVWSHNWDQPVSRTLSVEEILPGDDRLPKKTRTGDDWPANAGALYVETQFNIGGEDNTGTQRARDAFSDVKFYGEDQEWSIGYNVPPGASRVDGKTGVRELSYIDLYEYSPVLFGAMSLTATAGFKEAQETWKAKVQAGEAKEGMVVEEEREPEGAGDDDVTSADISMGDVVVVPAGTKREDASRLLAEAVSGKGQEATTEDSTEGQAEPVATGFDQVTDDTPITTPADPVHQATPGHTGKPSGVEVEPRPGIEGAPGEAEVTEPKSAEFTVGLSERGKAALAEVQAWFAAEAGKAGADLDALGTEAFARAAAVMEDRDNYAVKVRDVDAEAKAYVLLTGSYEERQAALQRQADDLRDGFDLDGEDDWGYPRYYVTTEATFANRVVFAAYDFLGDDPVRYFEAAYTFDGQQATLRNPREVRIEAAVAAKSARVARDLKLVYEEFRAKGRRIAAGLDMPGLAPTAAVEEALGATEPEPGAKAADAGESKEVLTEADLLMLERLKLDA